MIESLWQELAKHHSMPKLCSDPTCESLVVQKLSEEFRHATVYPEDRLAGWRPQIQCPVIEPGGLTDFHMVRVRFLQLSDRARNVVDLEWQYGGRGSHKIQLRPSELHIDMVLGVRRTFSILTSTSRTEGDFTSC